jgi:hypothetical protein
LSRLGRQRLGEAKVEDFDGSVRTQLDVGRLEIAMNDAPFVGSSERISKLFRDLDCFVQRDGPVSQLVRERLALDELHDDAAAGAHVLEAIDLSDVRMIQRGEELRFALEPREPVRIVGEMIRQNLEGDVAQQLRIAGAQHDAHRAFPELRDDFIWADTRAR